MARTPSTMLELGTLAPDFRLPEPATGKEVALGDLRSADCIKVIVGGR